MSEQVVVIYRALVAPEYREEVLAAFDAIALRTHAEPGCLGWAIHQNIADPNEIIEVSQWVDEEASNTHGVSEHVQWILEVLTRPGVLQQPGTLSTTRALGLGTVEKGYLSYGR